ncbi:hypothetical protein H206_06182 [Candidatus Electrothrix aarhusensis]|uniref:Uncharacterized protein n=1 Tax=Candidatus Electrothrix aarhusensis TaxID=1859131 RepID=A0A444J3W0_9BACT|nr:hypothetical protein H206_06182 [Candidatus Electrothrix aarhusensis]
MPLRNYFRVWDVGANPCVCPEFPEKSGRAGTGTLPLHVPNYSQTYVPESCGFSCQGAFM